VLLFIGYDRSYILIVGKCWEYLPTKLWWAAEHKKVLSNWTQKIVE